jgi:hypothetical protein
VGQFGLWGRLATVGNLRRVGKPASCADYKSKSTYYPYLAELSENRPKLDEGAAQHGMRAMHAMLAI